MIKESELTECVQSSLKAHINSVVSLNSLITSISRERINQGLVQEYTGYSVKPLQALHQIKIRFVDYCFVRILHAHPILGGFEFAYFQLGYIKSNEEQLARVEKFKRNLYESLVSGALSQN